MSDPTDPLEALAATDGAVSVPTGWRDAGNRMSFSAAQAHRKCPQAWSYANLRGLEKVGVIHRRDLGSWWHLVRAMDSIERGLAAYSLRYAPKHLSTGAENLRLERVGPQIMGLEPDLPPSVIKYRLPNGVEIPASRRAAHAVIAAYWRTLSADEKDGWIEEIGEPLPDRIAYMDARWRERWAEDLANEDPIAVELKWTMDLPGTDGGTSVGYVDEVYRDTRRNLIVVRDHKSMGSLPPHEAADDLNDSQLHLYAEGAAATLRDLGVLQPISALSYDRARSAMPKQPAVTKTTGALSKSVTDYDLHTYLAFVGEEGVDWGEADTFVQSGKNEGKAKFGTYAAEPEVIERLRSPSARAAWHVRTLTPLNRNVIAEHLRSLSHTQVDAVRTVDYFAQHGSAPRNFTRQGCKFCDFVGLCRAEVIGGSGGDYPLEQFGLQTRKPRS